MKIFLALILAALADIVPGGPSFLNPLEKKDTVRVADQFEYGFELKDVKEGTDIALPRLDKVFNDTLTLVRDWKLDTLKKTGVIRASIVIAPFEEGEFGLPPLSAVLVDKDNRMDTLVFDPQSLSVVPLQVDTATFEIKDLKGQINYPVTFMEVLPWVVGVLLLAALAALAVYLVRKYAGKKDNSAQSSDPAYIVALRELERYRSDKYWAPERQKAFYSGITDSLKAYIAGRYGFDAPEMTTAELFSELDSGKDIAEDMRRELRAMFEEADFVKFAKHFSDRETIAGALPLAIRFVMDTCQQQKTETEEV